MRAAIKAGGSGGTAARHDRRDRPTTILEVRHSLRFNAIDNPDTIPAALGAWLKIVLPQRPRLQSGVFVSSTGFVAALAFYRRD